MKTDRDGVENDPAARAIPTASRKTGDNSEEETFCIHGNAQPWRG